MASTLQQNDVTTAIRDAVSKMIARAAVKKNEGKQFTVDVETCHDFIDQQMELVPHPSSSTEGVIYRNVTIARNGTQHTFKVPISHKNVEDHAKTTESHCEIEGVTAATASLDTGTNIGLSGFKGYAKRIRNMLSKGFTAKVHVPAGTTNVTARGQTGMQYSEKETNQTYHEVKVNEVDVSPDANVTLAPKGSSIFQIKLVLKGLRNAEVNVYQKSIVESGARIGAGVGAVAAGVPAVAGGATLGAVIGGVIGTVVPGIGNVIGIAIGGSVGGIVGGAGLGVAGAGLGAGLGAAAGAGGAAAHTALRPITLTIQDIFSESQESVPDYIDQAKNSDYIHCAISCPYIADLTFASIESKNN